MSVIIAENGYCGSGFGGGQFWMRKIQSSQQG